MKKIDSILFFIAIIGSLFSQNPIFIMSGTYQWLKYLWILPLLFFSFNHPSIFFSKKHNTLFVFLLLFLSYCLLCQVVFGANYLGPDIDNMTMSIVIFVTSATYWKLNRSLNNLKKLAIITLVVGLLLANFVYSGFISETEITGTYAYAPKNSLSSILLCCCMISIINYSPRNKLLRLGYILVVVYLLLVIVLLRSRATILGVIFIVIYYTLKIKNKHYQLLLCLIIVLGCSVIFFSEDLYNIIVISILMSNNSDISELNSVSSGRVDIVNDAFHVFMDNIFFGIGSSYVESMPVAMLVQYGLFGTSIVFALIIYLFIRVYRKNSIYTESKTAFLLFVVFLLNSLFEAQAPFGPGAKSFLMWMMMGFASTLPDKDKLKLGNHICVW